MSNLITKHIKVYELKGTITFNMSLLFYFYFTFIKGVLLPSLVHLHYHLVSLYQTKILYEKNCFLKVIVATGMVDSYNHKIINRVAPKGSSFGPNDSILKNSKIQITPCLATDVTASRDTNFLLNGQKGLSKGGKKRGSVLQSHQKYW